MIVNRAAIERQPLVIALLVLIVIAGAWGYLTLPREDDPDVTIPYIFVSTRYEGVSAADMETLITIPIERKLKGIADTEELKSTSSEGLSLVALKFLPKVDLEDALQRVKDKVDEAKRDLPQDMPEDPYVEEFNLSDVPIIRVVLSGPYSLKRLKVFADDFKDRLESISGVLEARLSGGLEREIHVEFDLDRIVAYQVPFSSLANAVSKSNVNMPGGSMDIGQAKYTVRVPEEYEHPAEIFNIVAFVKDGRPVYLRDLAVIEDSNKDPVTRSRIDRQPAVTVSVIKRSGENIVRICDEVKQIVAEMRPRLPDSLKIDVTSDKSDTVRTLVGDLENNILSGLILVLLVILLFIGGRSALFVSLAIPYSMLITFILLTAMSVTLNMIVLFSLILALGMLVDNGIVIVENIYRHMQMGKTRLQAARDGTDEVAWPVITSTLTTVGAFVPMLFWPGVMGQFMGYLPLTVILALAGSLFVALVINPVLSARYQTVKAVPAGDGDAVKLGLLVRLYRRLLLWALRHRLLTVGVAGIMLVASILAFGMFGKGVEFFPDTDPDWATIHIKTPVGTNLDTSDALVAQVESVVSEYPDIRHVITQVGAEGGNPFETGGSGTHINEVNLDFKEFEDRVRSSQEVVDEIRQRLMDTIRGAELRVEQEKEGPPSGAPINLEISGEDIEELGQIAAEVRKAIRDVPGLVDLKDDYMSGKPEIRVRIDKEKAALHGLDAYTIAYTVKGAVNGIKVGVYREGKDEYDIITRLMEKDRTSLESLKRLTVAGPMGEPIPVTSLARFEVTSGLGGIIRKNQKRVVTVSGEDSGRLANDIIVDITRRLNQMEWPRGVTWQFTGEQEEQGKAQAFLTKAFVATVFIILIVLLAQFNSFIYPVIVITSVSLSLIGVFAGLLITGHPFGVIMTGIGVISLAGVVVNNAIVLIDYYKQLLATGLTCHEALIQTGLTRFRPVMLTAITTILGLVPMAVGVSIDFHNFTIAVGGTMTQFWASMATAVIFGLAVATLLTLVVVPVLCSLVYRWAEKGGEWAAGV